MTDDGGAEIDFDPSAMAAQAAQQHDANLADFLEDDILNEIASDLEEYFIQYLGRVFRTEDGIPFIFDLVDNFKVLQNHYYTRRRVYIDHGGKVVDFKLKKVKEYYNLDSERAELFNEYFL